MKFIKLKWKNLLSYGNKIQEFVFEDKPQLILINGDNGAGKSSIKEALTISAYGKSAIRKIKDIPNWINKAAYTYIEFETSKKDNIIIERGIDPNFNNILINGVPYNLPDKRKIDDFVESDLLNLNFSIFCNTISLSFDDFKSFINLSPGDKRKIIDPIFGIDLLTDMRSYIKEDLKENKKKLDILDSNINRNNNLLEKSSAQLIELRKKIEVAAVGKINDIKLKLKDNNKDANIHQTKYKEIKNKIESIQSKMSNLRQKSADSNAKISQFNEKLKIFEKNKCPHCFSDLTSNDAIKIKELIDEKKKAELVLLDDIIKNQSKIKDILTDLTKNQDIEKDKFYSLSSDIKSLELELSKFNNKSNDDQEDSVRNIIKTIKDEIKELDTDSIQYRDKLDMCKILDEIVSDSGVKRVLIDRVIPMLNSRILEISDRLDFKFRFEFNNEFDPVITYLGMNISPNSLSTGQRKKMNIIVLLSFIELIKLKHNNMNAMFLDEIFSGLDKNNVYKAIEILREYADKYNMTIFVVSHENLPEEFFDKNINVTVSNHFSDMKIVSNVNTKKEPI